MKLIEKTEQKGRTLTPEKTKAFYWRLKSLQPDYCITDTRYSAYLKVSRGQLSRWRNGRNVPDTVTVERLAKKLRVSPAWLQYGE